MGLDFRNLEFQISIWMSRKRGLADNLLPNGNYQVDFSHDFHPGKYKLIELPKEVEAHVKQGGRLELKGSITGKDVVLCTEDRTYAVKKVENSNGLFLMSDCCKSLAIVTQNDSIYEV